MILPDRELIFIHIARSGGTSIETALAGKDWWLISPETKHLSATQTRKLVGDQIWRSSFKASIVRNPWDRVVSMYATGWWNRGLEMVDPEQHFSHFIRTLKPHPHERYASLHYREILDAEIDYIGRYEDLQGSFDAICQAIGIEKRPLPHVEQRRRNHYSQYYSADTRAIVETLFHDDITEFGYSFEGVVPYDFDALGTLMIRSLENAAAA